MQGRVLRLGLDIYIRIAIRRQKPSETADVVTKVSAVMRLHVKVFMGNIIE